MSVFAILGLTIAGLDGYEPSADYSIKLLRRSSFESFNELINESILGSSGILDSSSEPVGGWLFKS